MAVQVLEPVATVSGGLALPGRPEQCSQARLWTRSLLHPFPDVADAVELVASEFFTNAIRYTASGRPGGRVGLTLVGLSSGIVHLEIVDQGCAEGTAAVLPPAVDRTHGRGLFLAEALAQAWGQVPTGGDPRYGPFAAAPEGHRGPLVTWADFLTKIRPASTMR
ncbi:ATP-binding protein [Nocardiopsis potens]|uniref:ATP-binding protein n=1 Tax=Nocardiopsis potens TaxID=1246458 RepID=UPI0003498C30|nr:ATP-binding protein [Nocardiopsis potens]